MKYECKLCALTILDSEFLSAPSPFDPEDILHACPQCKQVSDGFEHLCGIEGCRGYVSCGFPVPQEFQEQLKTKYLHACIKHAKQYWF